MAVLTVQDALVTGLAQIVFDAADPAGDTTETGASVVLLVHNNDTVARTVTVDTPGTVGGLDIENPATTIAAGDIGAVPMIGRFFGAVASVTYDDATALVVAVVRVAR